MLADMINQHRSLSVEAQKSIDGLFIDFVTILCIWNFIWLNCFECDPSSNAYFFGQSHHAKSILCNYFS
jgi:hypothetical protein